MREVQQGIRKHLVQAAVVALLGVLGWSASVIWTSEEEARPLVQESANAVETAARETAVFEAGVARTEEVITQSVLRVEQMKHAAFAANKGYSPTADDLENWRVIALDSELEAKMAQARLAEFSDIDVSGFQQHLSSVRGKIAAEVALWRGFLHYVERRNAGLDATQDAAAFEAWMRTLADSRAATEVMQAALRRMARTIEDERGRHKAQIDRISESYDDLLNRMRLAIVVLIVSLLALLALVAWVWPTRAANTVGHKAPASSAEATPKARRGS